MITLDQFFQSRYASRHQQSHQSKRKCKRRVRQMQRNADNRYARAIKAVGGNCDLLIPAMGISRRGKTVALDHV